MIYDKKKKEKILIVDDSEMNRSILADMLDDEYEIIEAENGIIAVSILEKHLLDISLVLLDVVMPKMNGLEVLEVMNKNHWIDDIPVIMISAEKDSSMITQAYGLGITDFITRPFDALIVRKRVVNTIFLYAKQKKLIEMVDAQIYEKERISRMMINILSHIVEFRNRESGFHIINIRSLTEALLKQFQNKSEGKNITQDDISLISNASALHDIGKIAIDDKILNKPGKLTDEEFSVMKTHSLFGAQMLEQIPGYKDDPLVKTAYEICRWHHERYDGRGYPDGLKGDEIPFSAQIVSLADVYEALTSERVYKKAFTHETAMRMINEGKCGAFNPILLECLNDMSENLCDVLNKQISQENLYALKSSAREMIYQDDSISSAHSLRLVDYERMKYSLFASITEEIQFEYTPSPSMLILSEQGAKKLGTDEVIINPESSKHIEKIVGLDVWNSISEKLHSSCEDDFVVKGKYKLSIKGESRWHKIITKAVWSNDNPPKFMGAIGKAIDIHDTQVKIEKLEKQVSRDALTGLLNHTYAKKRIVKQLEMHPESKYALIICDLDNFKCANDNCGHMFGDGILKELADKLQKNTRSNDIVCRVGGDEFLIFMEYKHDIEPIIERIFSSLNGDFNGFSYSISMGVAKTSVVGKDYDTLFVAADNALYSAKRYGRGRYCIYDKFMKNTFSVISPINSNSELDISDKKGD